MSGEEGERTMNLTLHVWRQKNRQAEGAFVTYQATGISSDMSFLEMLDVVNEGLIAEGEEPIAFDHDCREGICGQCGVVINGSAAWTRRGHDVVPAPHAQLPGRRRVDDRAVASRVVPGHQGPDGRSRRPSTASSPRAGSSRCDTGNAPDANDVPVPKTAADLAMDAAACIGCGACVAACPNASAMLFVAAKASHLNLLPQGQPERLAAPWPWSTGWTPRASAAAPTTRNARPPAPRKSACTSSRC